MAESAVVRTDVFRETVDASKFGVIQKPLSTWERIYNKTAVRKAVILIFLAVLVLAARRSSRQFGEVFRLQIALEERTHALNRANAELRAEVPLERSQVMRDGGLADVETPGCPHHRALARDRPQRLELTQIQHARTLPALQ